MKYTSFAVFLVVLVVHAALLVSAGNYTSRHSLSKRGTKGTGTWYSGSDLDDAYCYGRNGLPNYTPTDSDMIASIKMKGLTYCYKCIQVTCGSKSVILKVVDDCAGCGNGNDVDMTTSAFKALQVKANLNVGELKISWVVLSKCPSSGKWIKTP
ncbi:hypothetical protein BC937DRAFT_92053 [Endogone sp. FLAS-F59071]|nr:hypothetical protein BC937DRAFT_92053 [Endogone sp. FLAS-F59071]|eukprot:RUS15740.1 hypothetical protein BC937DRAFT_92053 [Endogone sp. FLAS-F59071]